MTLLERRHPDSIELGLDRCGRVYRNMGSPRPAKTIYTIAGTNGKGSTVAYIAAIITATGQRCGTYTSPHLINFNERIDIMGTPVSDESLVTAFEQVEAARRDISLTYFEFTTLAAFLILQQAELDCAVLEVGLGGRLDTVNLIDADCTVITPIGLDHQDFLGDDLESIAAEKAGILRARVPLICSQPQPPHAVTNKAAELDVPVYLPGSHFRLHAVAANALEFSMAGQNLKLPFPPMVGQHQLDNLAAAVAAVLVSQPGCIEFEDEIALAISDCRLAGRMQKISSAPDVLLDVGHNTLAAEAVADYFRTHNISNVTCVLSVLADKPAEELATVLAPFCKHWICADSDGERGQTGACLRQRLSLVLTDAEISHQEDLPAAMRAAWASVDKHGTILVFGSFFTVSAVMRAFDHRMQR